MMEGPEAGASSHGKGMGLSLQVGRDKKVNQSKRELGPLWEHSNGK